MGLTGFSSSIKAQHQYPHLLLADEPRDRLRVGGRQADADVGGDGLRGGAVGRLHRGECRAAAAGKAEERQLAVENWARR